MFQYAAKVEAVVDGDTIDVAIDLGFKIQYRLRVRLNGIDCPEIHSELGKTVKAYVESALVGKDVVLNTYKPDKYGRWLADVILAGADFNKELISLGYAHPYDGGVRIPW
jgi:micrococcal nuclease